MIILIVGLVLFLGTHLTQTLSPSWYAQRVSELGENKWKGLYSIISIAGFVLLIYGYSQARGEATQLYGGFGWARSALFVAMPLALVLFVASQLPAGFIKRTLGHPQLIGVSLWSAFHLLANGDAASVLLFGSFLVWSLLTLRSCFFRTSTTPAKMAVWADGVSIFAGLALTYFFLAYAHAAWIGVSIT